MEDKNKEEKKIRNEHSQNEGKGQETQDFDVILDVPKLKVDDTNLNVEDLKAKVSLSANLGSMVEINIGADVHVEKLKLELKGVEAEAHLRVRLERVKQIFNRALQSLDQNPEILKELGKSAGEGASGSATEQESFSQKAGKAMGGEKIKMAAYDIKDKITDFASIDAESKLKSKDQESSQAPNVEGES